MISMVEGAKRSKTPNEIALTILLAALSIVFLLAVATLWPFTAYTGHPVTLTVMIALLVCLIPTTISGLLSAIGVAGMSRMLAANVIATSGRAVEAAGMWTCCCWTKPAPSHWVTAGLCFPGCIRCG